MTTGDRIAEHSFCYDPDFPPDIPEGLPLVRAPRSKPPAPKPVRRALKACGEAAATLARRPRPES